MTDRKRPSFAEVERDALREEVARLLAEQSAEVPDLWASNDALRADRDALAAHNARLLAALRAIAGGILPDGDHVSQPVVMYAEEALFKAAMHAALDVARKEEK